jgi:hypothetical protein
MVTNFRYVCVNARDFSVRSTAPAELPLCYKTIPQAVRKKRSKREQERETERERQRGRETEGEEEEKREREEGSRSKKRRDKHT